MDKVIVGGSLIPSTVDTPLDKRARVATFAEIANIENPARFMTIVVEDTGRHYEVRKLSSKVIGGLVVENAGIDIDDPEALYDLTAVEEARVEAERKREEEENTRKRNEKIRQENESERGVNESQRQLSEDERESSEISREEHEQIRMANENERKQNETSRQSKELSREQYEASRKSSETERRNSENKRIENENTRKSNESQREINENQRKSNETERQSKENTRISAEDRRLSSEATREANELNRKNNESTRVQNETERVSNENARVKSENERKTEYAGLKSELEEQIENAKNFDSRKADIDGQYDKLTSGNSQNLIGRGNATPEEFNFRPSGDISIQDGTARVKKLKGNSVVWNQLVNYETVIELKDNVSYDETTGIFSCSPINQAYLLRVVAPILGNVYFTKVALRSTQGATVHVFNGGVVPKIITLTDKFTYYNIIYTADASNYLGIASQDSVNPFEIKDYNIFNLTKMFGAGNEPTTVEEFEALYPDSYYPYNPGEIKSLTATHIKSVGFNAWDGKYEYVNIDWENGDFLVGTSRISNKNLIRVIPNKEYYFSYSNNLSNIIVFYNSEYKRVSNISIDKSSKITIPSNACYLKFGINTTSVSIVNDICINLSNTGYRDGEYHPYVDFNRELQINKIKDSEGNLLFPDGLCSAGSVYDEITEKKAIKRIGKVDLGTLPWVYTTNNNLFYTVSLNTIPLIKVNGKVLNTKYIQYNGSVNSISDKSINTSSYFYPNALILADSSYTDAISLKESLQGVYLYYELATPIEVDLDPEVNMDYEVWDFGTEQMISDGFSTPIKADIVYGFNAVDRIRENSLNIEDLIKRIVQLETKITNLETTQANENNQVD